MSKDISGEDNLLAESAFKLSMVEIGLGSLLHSFRLPGTGQWLSLNQTYFLGHLSQSSGQFWAGLKLSTVVALLKSLSPAGKKITPMLAITMQGLLFNLGFLLGGRSFFGHVLGATLSSLWAWAQPLILLLFLWGDKTGAIFSWAQKEVHRFFPHLSQYLFLVLFSLVILKILLAITLSLMGAKNKRHPLLYFKFKYNFLTPEKNPSSSPTAPPLLLAVKDLLRPLPLFGLALNSLFIYLTAAEENTAWGWNLLRPWAVGLILFYFLRKFPIEKIPMPQTIQKSLRLTLEKLKGNPHDLKS